ncbi:hypothetical protein DSM104443_04124 [Usitatibacter rugosus]|uniref:LTXXQ motif family protein n=1 Tax=Usitatibacter rugosus TaxID=2732067 RepID=A0A6M4H0K1_9PROT|nr:hypothetical protein [Usitatibacter rugosus]QJR13030.1 hypothetical protein DSM104443_04124 [Usitatibacter rugosus]
MFFRRLLALLFAGAITTTVLAQRPDGPPPRPDLSSLNLDATRSAKVEAILTASREKMRAVREDTDKQLATVLNADELAKLKQLMPRPPGPPRH